MKRMKDNLLRSILLAGALLMATTLVASGSESTDAVSDISTELSAVAESVEMAADINISPADNDQDPKKAVKGSKDKKAASTEECKSGSSKAEECKEEKSKNCEEKASTKKGCEGKKCGEG